jgi:hypothetical protein
LIKKKLAARITLLEEEREDVEKKVGEALDENFTALAEREKKKRGEDAGTEL